MRLVKKRGILGVFIIGVIASVICASVGVTERNDKVYYPRMNAPDYTNYCYYSENIFYNSGYGMPNCTAYAWGRVYELLKKKPKLCTGNARDWYDYNKANGIYPCGNEPRLGAVACFDNEYGGHVAVVEDIDGETITFSNSAYNGKNFYLSYADIDDTNPGQDGWSFQGYIYPESFKRDNISYNSVRRVSAGYGLNLRECAGISSEISEVIPDNTEVYIYSVFKRDGYLWGRTVYNGKTGYCAVDYTLSV